MIKHPSPPWETLERILSHRFLSSSSIFQLSLGIKPIFLFKLNIFFRITELGASFYFFRRLSLYAFRSGCDGIQGLGLSGSALELNLLPVPGVCVMLAINMNGLRVSADANIHVAKYCISSEASWSAHKPQKKSLAFYSIGIEQPAS